MGEATLMTGTLIVTGVRSKIITELATLTDYHVAGVGKFPPSEHPKPWVRKLGRSCQQNVLCLDSAERDTALVSDRSI